MFLSPIFERAFWNRGAHHDGFWDLLESLQANLTFDPRSAGEPHPHLPGIWVYESPPVARLPKVFILYTIDDETGIVRLRNFCIR